MDDSLIIAGRPFSSRLLMGTGKFSSNNVMQKALEASGSEIVTVALRRVDLENPDDDLLNAIDTSRYLLLPNTSGARDAQEAVRLARLARAAGCEPWVKLEVMTPVQYLGRILEILEDLKGKALETQYLGQDKALLAYEVPLKGIITGFYDNLKSVSQGYASMNYEMADYKTGDLVKMEILIAGEKEEAFSKIVYKDRAHKEGRCSMQY